MELEKTPFVKERLDEEWKEGEKPDTFTMRLNEEERKILNKCKKVLEQPKDSTAIKTLALIGAKVIHEDLQAYVLGCVFKNKRNNARLGITEIE